MAKYTVQHTPILHGKKGDKEASRYEIGSEIDLTDAEAGRLGDNILPAEETSARAKGKGVKE